MPYSLLRKLTHVVTGNRHENEEWGVHVLPKAHKRVNETTRSLLPFFSASLLHPFPSLFTYPIAQPNESLIYVLLYFYFKSVYENMCMHTHLYVFVSPVLQF